MLPCGRETEEVESILSDKVIINQMYVFGDVVWRGLVFTFRCAHICV